jgi:topoisomerase-4 subunit B
VTPARPARTRPLSPPPAAAEADYDASSIEVLEGLEPVRRRPGMYIGGTDEKAFHHLFAEVIDNSMDEAVAGHATFIEVELEEGGFLTVTDNGRGIPVDPHPKFPKKSALEVILTTLHAGGKFDSKVYETSGGLHGVGVSVVNALSDVLEVEVARNQTLYRQTYSRGMPQGPIKEIGRVLNRRGTKVRFHPDAQIFGPEARFNPRRVFKMARSKAYLFGGVEIRWKCAPSLLVAADSPPPEATFRFPGGLRDYLLKEIEGTSPDCRGPLLGQGHEARRPRIARVGGRVACGRGWLLDLVLQHHPHPEGGTQESGPASRATARPSRTRRANQPGQANDGRDDGRRHGAMRIHALGFHSRARVPGPDQGQARYAGSRPNRREHGAGCLRSLARSLARSSE